MSKITIEIPRKKMQTLSNLAVRYGLAVEDLASKVISSISSDIGEESWTDYDSASKTSFNKGLADYRAGKIYRSL